MNNPFKALSRSRRASEQSTQPNTPAQSTSVPVQSSATPEPTAETLVYTTRAQKPFPTIAQWRYFSQLLSRFERILLQVCVLLIVVSAIAASWRAYDRATVVVPQTGGTYTEGLVGSPRYINPVLAPLSDVDSDLSALLYPGLFKHNDQQQLQPDLITNYVISEDQLTYTFYLRSDVKWHDGEQLNSDDVLFTIGVIQDPLAQSPLRSSFDGVTATKIDDFSFSLKLKEPFAPFLTSLTFGILPQHIWFSIPTQNITLTGLNLQPVGAGPFQFESLTKDQAGNIKSFKMVRNDDYYGQKPYIDEMNFLFYPDISTATEALQDKKIEGLAFLPQESKQMVTDKNEDVIFHSMRIPQYTAVFFNQKKSEVLRDKSVRIALATAVDRDAIIQEALGGLGEAIYTPILPGYVGHNAEIDKHPFDIEKSKKILDDAGWKFPATIPDENGDGQPDAVPREKNGVKLEFSVSTVELPEYQTTMAILQKKWGEIGVKVNINTYSAEDIQNIVIKNRDYDALLFGEIIGSDPDPYAFWHSSQQEHPGLALAIFRDKDIDGLLTGGRKTSNEEERRLLYFNFQNNLANELPTIFLYNPLYSYAQHKKVKGIPEQQYIVVPADRFSGVTNWYIKTDRTSKQ